MMGRDAASHWGSSSAAFEKTAEQRIHQRAQNGGQGSVDAEAVDQLPGKVKHDGIDEKVKDAQGQDGDRQGQDGKNGPHEKIDQPNHKHGAKR